MTLFIPDNHIVGKVYDFTQENFNALLSDWERLRAEVERVKKLEELLHEFANETHEGDCRLDHNDFCQTHYSKPCLVAESRAVLEKHGVKG